VPPWLQSALLPAQPEVQRIECGTAVMPIKQSPEGALQPSDKARTSSFRVEDSHAGRLQ
jgi:hypothetical protein